jgi:hemerythrin
MWDADLLVGKEFMDDEHEVLRSTLSELGEVVLGGYDDIADVVRATRLLERLLTETGQHFAHEEAVMRRHDYPQIGDHVARHTKFLGELAEIHGQFAAGRQIVVSHRVVRRVQAWFARHIITSDLPLAEWLKLRAGHEADPSDPSCLPSRVSLW